MIVAALGALGALSGAWAWWQGSLERGFWILWRVTQIATTTLAAVALIVFALLLLGYACFANGAAPGVELGFDVNPECGRGHFL